MSLCYRDVIYLLKLVDVLILTELSFQYILRFYGGKAMGVKLPGKTVGIFSLYLVFLCLQRINALRTRLVLFLSYNPQR